MRILICTFDSFGFLYPMIGLANSFKRLGYDIHFIGSKSIKEIVLKQGIRWIEHDKESKDAFLIKRFGDLEDISNQIKYVEYAVSNFSYDLVVTSPLSFGTILAAERYSLRVVTLGFFSYLWVNDINIFGLPKKIHDHCKWRTTDMFNTYMKSRASLGFQKINHDLSRIPFTGDLMLQRSVPGLMHKIGGIPEKTVPFGSCIWEPETVSDTEEMLENWLNLTKNRDRKVLYVNQGRTFYMKGFWSLIKSIFGASDYLVIADVNRMDGFVGEVPDNFFLANHIPIRAVVSHASLFISAGHTTSVLAALENAIPMLLFPSGGETVDNSFYCEKIGVATVFHEDSYNEQQISETVDRIIKEQKFSETCRQMSNEFDLYKGDSYRSGLIKSAALRLSGHLYAP